MKLLFDYGGVIVDLKREASIAAFDAIGFDIRPYLGTFKQGGVFSLLENGDIALSGFCDEIRKHSSGAPTDAQIIAAWEAYVVGVPAERLALLLKIRQHYSTFVLSNTNVVHWEQGKRDFFSWNGHSIDDFFDGIFVSYEMHLQKPQPAIFEAVVTAMGCPADEILFLDDSEDNCEAARRCGLRARIAPAGGIWMNYFDDNGRLLNENI